MKRAKKCNPKIDEVMGSESVWKNSEGVWKNSKGVWKNPKIE